MNRLKLYSFWIDQRKYKPTFVNNKECEIDKYLKEGYSLEDAKTLGMLCDCNKCLINENFLHPDTLEKMCPICNKVFRENENRLYHLQKEHKFKSD